MEGITYCSAVCECLYEKSSFGDTCSHTIRAKHFVSPIILLASTLFLLALSHSVPLFHLYSLSLCVRAVCALLCPLAQYTHSHSPTNYLYTSLCRARVCVRRMHGALSYMCLYISRALFNVSYVVFRLLRWPPRMDVPWLACIGNDFYFTFNVKMVPRSIDSIYDYISVFSLSLHTPLCAVRQLPFPFCRLLYI